jgi:hypothetical protein
MNYTNKYNKYKNKYMSLKNILHGGTKDTHCLFIESLTNRLEPYTNSTDSFNLFDSTSCEMSNNTGICYFNAIFLALMNCPSLNFLLIKLKDLFDRSSTTPTGSTYSFLNLYTTVFNNVKNNQCTEINSLTMLKLLYDNTNNSFRWTNPDYYIIIDPILRKKYYFQRLEKIINNDYDGGNEVDILMMLLHEIILCANRDDSLKKHF